MRDSRPPPDVRHLPVQSAADPDDTGDPLGWQLTDRVAASAYREAVPQGPDIPKLTADVNWTPPPRRSRDRRALTRFDALGVFAGAAAFALFVAPGYLVMRHPWPELVHYFVPSTVGASGALVALTVHWTVANRGQAHPLSWIKAKDRRGLAIFHCALVGALAFFALLAAPDEGAVLYLFAAACLVVLILRLRFDGYLRPSE